MDGLGLDGLNHLGIYLAVDSKELNGVILGMRKRWHSSFLAPVKGGLENHAFISQNVFMLPMPKMIWDNFAKNGKYA